MPTGVGPGSWKARARRQSHLDDFRGTIPSFYPCRGSVNRLMPSMRRVPGLTLPAADASAPFAQAFLIDSSADACAGIDTWHCGNGPCALRDEYGDRLCLIGDTDSVHTLSHGSERAVRKDPGVLELFEGSSASFLPATTMIMMMFRRNLMAMLTAYQDFSDYERVGKGKHAPSHVFGWTPSSNRCSPEKSARAPISTREARVLPDSRPPRRTLPNP